MPRPKKAMPDYRYHVSGQAVVTLDGSDFYLGEYDSPESRAKYFALLSEYNSNGLKAPDKPKRQIEQTLTVRCVTGEFRQHMKTKYANNVKELRRYRGLCDLIELEYGEEPASDFGPRKLSRLREVFIASGNSRNYVNRQVRNIVLIFKHAVSCEIVKPDQLVSLNSLEPLRYGQTEAPEPDPVTFVEIDIVKATAKHLSPTVKAMVRVQAATGMRPGEVCKMRPCDIDRSREDWIYRPAKHKTAHRGKTKAVPIVGDAREAIVPLLFRDPEAFCFSPQESSQWYRDQRSANRVTPDGPGRNKPGTNVKANPKSRAGDMFSTNGYHQAIKRAAKKAKVDHWFPYQLRHLAGTVVRDALGVEAAQALLGHSKAAMTEHYAKQTEEKAIQAAKAGPSIA
ncbi:site-specific integrase [Novipirellula rosea]|uniref:Site-specific integrase n=1 Tax=Novipirellula rosea TaxID=1031540 RepID=A0ABP8NHE7_9BACT